MRAVTAGPNLKPAGLVVSGEPWVRYIFAIVAAALVIVLKLAATRAGAGWLSPFLPGIGAVIAAAAWAGPGPGIACAILITAYSAIDLRGYPLSLPDISARCAVFLAESLALCFASARMLRSAAHAADSETWHRQLVETASEGIWVREIGGLIIYANARMAEMLGTTSDRMIGRHVEEFSFLADIPVERIRSETLISGIREQFDRRLRRTDGSELWVLACCNLLEGTDGKPPSILAMMTDITERKRAEHALRRSEERFRNLFEGVLEGVYQSTPDGRILAANPMLLKMLGFSSHTELNDIHIANDLYADPNMRKRLLEQLEREGGFQNAEFDLRTRDGRLISVLENARVVRDEHGELLYYEGTLTDITARKRIEEQLRQAQKVEALGRLAGGIARDFDAVLNVITGHVEATLRHLHLTHPARISAEQALQDTAGARELISQLLSFSRRPVDPDAGYAAPNTGHAILLVDDEPLVRELSRDMMERQGYQVTSASDGDHAIRMAKKGILFDLMITALSVTDMTGTELARQMRAVQPSLKVLFIAGYADGPMNREDLSGDGSGLLVKPFSADSLGRKIRQMLAV